MQRMGLAHYARLIGASVRLWADICRPPARNTASSQRGKVEIPGQRSGSIATRKHMNGPGDYEWLRRGRGGGRTRVSLMSPADAASQP